VKNLLSGFCSVLKLNFSYYVYRFQGGEPYQATKARHLDLLVAMFHLGIIFRKNGPQAIELHIEEPETSDIFQPLALRYENHTGIERAIIELCDTMKITLSADFSQYDLPDSIFEKDHKEDPLSWEVKMAQAFLYRLQCGSPPLVCIESSRKLLPFELRPSFCEMESATKQLKKRA
jgi:hypothetical protein